MKTIKEQFESLPKIKEFIDYACAFWSESRQEYVGDDAEMVSYINGAWYAFQQQQKKIDLDAEYGNY